jgi:hypothetical protein
LNFVSHRLKGSIQLKPPGRSAKNPTKTTATPDTEAINILEVFFISSIIVIPRLHH